MRCGLMSVAMTAHECVAGDVGGAPWNTRLQPPTWYKILSELGCDSIA